MSAEIEPEIERDLFVAGSTRVEPLAGVADPRDQLTLDERVHVFVWRGCDQIGLLRDLRRNRIQARDDGLDIVRAEDAGAAKGLRPGLAAFDVFPEKPLVNGQRPSEFEDVLVRLAGEPARP